MISMLWVISGYKWYRQGGTRKRGKFVFSYFYTNLFKTTNELGAFVLFVIKPLC